MPGSRKSEFHATLIFTHSISQKQFNQFVKHWIRGSNPRLQHMILSIDIIDFACGEVYLNGIRWTVMKEEAKQKFREKYRLSFVNMIQIKRKDGTTSVIATEESENIHFIVLD
ncbi:hypothetical protein CRE_23087 [Caenorhabditis remanei]|uniref:Sdz-33 F-box domain-containing protein n=1 Tax=Caenorhabditis remanei TaxID=31234 RepID=E3N9F1_CAERE|nr:hypothetical protein CRE_23087 [Caenorhabditis remanei]